MAAAVHAVLDMDYDHKDLIPEVTRVVRSTMDEVLTDLNKNKTWACAKWAKVLIPNGMLQVKEKGNVSR